MLMTIVCEKCADRDEKTEKTRNKRSLPLLSCDWKWAVLSSLGPGRSNGYLKTGYVKCCGVASSGTAPYTTSPNMKFKHFTDCNLIGLLPQMFFNPSRVNKNNTNTTLCSRFSVFLKPFSMNWDWRMLSITNILIPVHVFLQGLTLKWVLPDRYEITKQNRNTQKKLPF